MLRSHFHPLWQAVFVADANPDEDAVATSNVAQIISVHSIKLQIALVLCKWDMS